MLTQMQIGCSVMVRSFEIHWGIGTIGRDVFLCFIVVVLIHNAYLSNSPLIVAVVVLFCTCSILLLDIVRKGVHPTYAILLSIILLFAPPTIIFDSPIEIFGVKILPLYFVIICIFPVYHYNKRKGVFLPNNLYLLPKILLLFSILQYPLMFLCGWQNDWVGISTKAALLLMIFSILLLYAAYNIFIRFDARTAFSLSLFILCLQLYQGYVCFYNSYEDHVLWFGTTRWLRLGLGYTGKLFNPIRMYAFFWDPNYLISLLAPLFLLTNINTLPFGRRVVVGFVFMVSVLMTLSYQSMLIALVVLVWSRLNDKQAILLKKTAVVSAYVLPLILLIIGALVTASMLPPPEIFSINERMHIVWAITQAIINYPLGIGLGSFETFSGQMFFANAMAKTMPPHGWLFEVLVSFGLIGYYLMVFGLSAIMKNSSKAGNIAFAGLMIWGITSPALLTPYFWFFFALTLVLANKFVPIKQHEKY